MPQYVALLRGINVGTAKQVPMALLRQACENLGWRDVTTVLRSGSVVFEASGNPPEESALRAEVKRLADVSSDVLVLGAKEFAEIAAANPLSDVSTNGSRLFTTFLSEPAGPVQEPDADDLAPEQLRVGHRAVYQWFPDGSTATKVPTQFWAQFAGIQTARNANTVAKILTLLSEERKKR